MGQDGASVTGKAAQRQLWGPRIGDAAASQKGMLCQHKGVYWHKGHGLLGIPLF